MPAPSDSPETDPIEDQLRAFRDARADDSEADPSSFAEQLHTEELRALFQAAVAREFPDAAAANSVEPCTLAGRYELVEAIGSGGTGQVWRAMDQRLGQQVAVKVLKATAESAERVAELALREGRLLARVSHPGVARILDAGSEGEHCYLVMEYVSGASLDDVLDWMRADADRRSADGLLACVGAAEPGTADIPLPGEGWHRTAVRIVVELLRVLEATHGAGVVHRDIKPANLHIGRGGRPVLLDFGHGLLRDLAPGKLTRGMFGTPAYAAPEQWSVDPQISEATDIYQVGVLLYELLTLERCFSDRDTSVLLHKIREGQFRRPTAVDKSVPGALEAIVLKAMETAPGRRYGGATEFRRELEGWLEGVRPDAARPGQTATRTARKFMRRHRAWLGLAVAIGIGVVGTLLLGGAAPGWHVVGAASIEVESEGATRFLGMLYARDEDGRMRYTAVRSSVGDQDSALVVNVPAGRTTVRLLPVGDRSPYPDTKLWSAFAEDSTSGANASGGSGEFEALTELMRRVAATVREREGEWLTRQDVESLRGPGRGGATGDLANIPLFSAEPWRVAEVSGSSGPAPRF